MSRLLVCGSRDDRDYHRVAGYMDDENATLVGLTVVIVGDCRGPDAFAARWAREHGVPVAEFAADWETHGRAAGPIRNQRMVDEARPTRALAFWDGSSRGTLDCISRCVKAGALVKIVPVARTEAQP